MRANGSNSTRVAFLLASCACLAFGVTHGSAQTKGTRLVIATPYSRQIDPTADEISAMKARAARERTATIANSKIGRRFLAFSTCSGTRAIGTPEYRLTGTDASGKSVAYDLAELDELRANVVDGNRTQFDVKRFPTIRPSALLQRQPSYTALRQDAEETAQAWVRTVRDDGSTACLIEQAATDGKWIVFAHLGKLAAGTVVAFDYAWDQPARVAPIWWAIPSVVRDETYPYKRKLALKH
jgi:hypothetical protein